MSTRVTRKQFLQTALWGGVSALALPRRLQALQVSGPPLDLVIRGGRIVDGTGRPAFDAAIGIRNGVIVDMGAIPDHAAREVLDAKGRYVCPGFIDPHAHEEILMLADPVLEKFVRQGVTTLINGNCGHSVTPYRSKTVLEYWWREALISKKRSQMNIEWEGVDGYAKAVAGVGATINSAVLLGYGGIRWGAMHGGHDRPPTADEWKELERLVASGLEQGAVGMSTGLAYRPCYYAKTDELVRIAKILAAHDAVYASHLRNGPTGAQEAVEIGEKAGCRVQISHFRGGSKAALALVTDANRRGIVTNADVIPQSTSHRRASNRMLEALMVFYPGVFDANEEELKSLLRNPKTRAEITKTIQFFNNDKNQVIVVRALTLKHKASVGQSIASLAQAAGKDPNDYYVERIFDEADPVVFAFDGDRREARAQGGGGGGPRQDPADQLPPGLWTTHTRFGPGSDSIPVDMDDPYGWYEHQRRGAFPGYFSQARANGVSIEQAVNRATQLPAEQFRIKDRGVLTTGKAADVMVFDANAYTYPTPAESDPNDPHVVASGVEHVVVGGTPVLRDGKLTGQKPGKVLIAVALLLTSLVSLPRASSSQDIKTRALTIENIFGGQGGGGARQTTISPDGRWIAITGEGPDGNGVYLVAAEESTRPKFWFEGTVLAWFPDGQRVLFSRQGDLWTMRLGSTEATQVTKDAENERDPSISPDGTWIAFYSTRSGHQDIWLVPSDGSAPSKPLTQAAMAEDDSRFAPAWSPDGKQIAYISNKSNYWHDDVWVIDVTAGKPRQLSKSLMAASTPAWSPDGRSIALLGTAKAGYWYEDLQDIWIVDAAKGTERTVKMQVPATDWLHSLPVYWSGDGSRLYFVYHERGDLNLWSVASSGGVATRITNQRGALRSLATTAKGDAFVYVRSGPVEGSEAYYLTNWGGPPRRLTQFADTWEGAREPQEIAYRSFDGLYIQGFLYLPPNMQEGAKYPALVQVHGGGTNSYLRTQNLLEQYLASKGYVVLAVNYRGGSGFGREFQDLGVNDWASGQAHDAAIAADFMRSLPYVNGKVGIYGYSYGGIMSMATIARHPDKYDAAVPMAGIYDFGDALTNADRLGKIFTRTGHGGPPEERKEVYARSNTLARIKDVKTPLLIMHGEADVRAPYRQYQLAVDILKKNGKVFESKSYAGEPHGFRNPANRVDMYHRLEAFFDRHLKSQTSSARP